MEHKNPFLSASPPKQLLDDLANCFDRCALSNSSESNATAEAPSIHDNNFNAVFESNPLTESYPLTNSQINQLVGSATNRKRNESFQNCYSTEFLALYRHNVPDLNMNSNAMENFDWKAQQSSDILLSPAEVPFGRRYAEIAQFRSHPNVDWVDKAQRNSEPFSSYDEKKSLMDCKEKSDDELPGDDEKENFCESNASLVSSSDGGVLAEGEDETSSESNMSGDSPVCDLGLVERLLRTHQIWFLPGIQRSGAVHLLQGKEEGNFIVRGSSQKNTMAVSVRLPPEAGPYIEHYLVQSHDGLLNLESSRFKFDSIPSLIAHYAQCCDELPVQLGLPKALSDAINRQQLLSLALLGSEFWRNAISSVQQPKFTPDEDSHEMKSPTETSGISTMDSSLKKTSTLCTFNKFAHKTSTSNLQSNSQLVDTPSDTASSMSSFATSSGPHQLLSPQSAVTSPSVEFCNLKSNSTSVSNLNSPSGIIGKTSTFKTQHMKALSTSQQKMFVREPESPGSNHFGMFQQLTADMSNENIEEVARPPRPTPPNTLNLVLRAAPPPPPRWSKPSTPLSPPHIEQSTLQSNNNFTVTTTVTFNMRQQQQTELMDIPVPAKRSTPQITERLSPEGGECSKLGNEVAKWEQVRSPINPFRHGESMRSKRQLSNRRKESKHYQESDILESPSVYCRSNLGDKISDYEDLWDHRPPSDSSGSDLMSPRKPLSDISDPSEKRNSFMMRNLPSPSTSVNEIVAITTNSPMQSKCTLDTILQQSCKQRSPFYSDPVDAVLPVPVLGIVRREQRLIPLPSSHRHSEPPPKGLMDTLSFISNAEQQDKLLPSPMAGSLDQLKNGFKKISNGRDAWPLDSSWEFLNNDSENGSVKDEKADLTPTNTQHKVLINYPPIRTLERKHCLSREMKPDTLTVFKLIAKKYPEINATDNLPTLFEPSSFASKFQRLSSYDNVESAYAASFINSSHSDDGTLFSEPWDSSQWDSFLPNTDDSTIHLSKMRPIISDPDETLVEDLSMGNNSKISSKCSTLATQKVATILRTRSCKDREILHHPRNKVAHSSPGEFVEQYTMQLAKDGTSTFSKNIDNFIACTKESRELVPQNVMRNIRQFMNGMKNYLVKHGEGDFSQEVQKARGLLKADEFLNLDQILEGVMHQLIIMPLREHLYTLLVDFYGKSGDIQILINNIKFAASKDANAFGIKDSVQIPSTSTLAQISSILRNLEEAELPFEKLNLLLGAVAAIFETAGAQNTRQLGADEFLPLLVYIVAKCGFFSAEIEAEYMWGLLNTSLLNGEAGYYITALCSAVQVLKSFMANDGGQGNHGSLDTNSSLISCSSVLRIIIPDESTHSIQTKTIPVRPNTTTKDVCRIIANKGRITNPQDYGLFRLIDGEETLLMDNICPQEARLQAGGKHCMLAYKRIDAKIAWPTSK